MFANPAAQLRTEPIPLTELPLTELALTEAELAAVQKAAVTPLLRVAAVLAAVHAARTGTIRHLQLAEVDLPARRIVLDGTL